jgi:hypothetical protein
VTPDELEARRRDYERQFRRAGLPLFIEDYSATSDIFTRAVPFLGVVFFLQVLNGIDPDWPPLANAAAVLGGLGILLAGLGVLNRSRGRRFWSVPERVGGAELAAFVLIPAILPLVFGWHPGLALETVIEQLVILGLVFVVVGYGVLSIVRWVGRRLLRQLASSAALLARAVPLLMIIVLIAFVNMEMWQVFAAIPGSGLGMIGALFVALGTAFLLARLPREVRALEREAGGASRPLDRGERHNVGLVLFISQAIQVLLVTFLIGGFFVVFGAIAVTEPVREMWFGATGDVLFTVALPGQTVEVTGELLRVCVGLAAFSGVYFAIAMLTDATYREEFLDELTAEMRATFKARTEYLSLPTRTPT